MLAHSILEYESRKIGITLVYIEVHSYVHTNILVLIQSTY